MRGSACDYCLSADPVLRWLYLTLWPFSEAGAANAYAWHHYPAAPFVPVGLDLLGFKYYKQRAGWTATRITPAASLAGQDLGSCDDTRQPELQSSQRLEQIERPLVV
jgi:hypothetical protein